MPDNSPWGPENPDEPITFNLGDDDDEGSAEDGDPVSSAPGQDLAVVAEASSSAYDSDWLGDDDYDHDGELIPAKKQLPSRLLRPQTNRRLARAYERRRKVVEMRIAGHTFPEIAKALKFNSVDGARDAFKRAMQDVTDVAEDYRDLELARLESATQVLWPMVESGDLEALDKYIKVAQLRIKITKMDQITHLGGAGMATDGDSADVERVGMVEDVQAFLSALPEMLKWTNQPAPLVIDQEGKFIGDKRED